MADIANTNLAAVIFDRDGVLNVDHGYVGEVERLTWIAGAKAAVRRLNEAGVKVLVATNQSGVARGYFDEASVARFHAAMQDDLAALGAHIDAFYVCPFHEDAIDPVYYCPFHPEAQVEAYRHPNHPDRKPNPGMVLKALAEWRLDPARVVLVGDKPSDMKAAAGGGVAGVLFPGGNLERFLVVLGILK
jgi:D-glycero-D-manno-heptose 1,7-bisphosphate phosphatase